MSKNLCKVEWCDNPEFMFYKYCKFHLDERKKQKEDEEKQVKETEKIDKKPTIVIKTEEKLDKKIITSTKNIEKSLEAKNTNWDETKDLRKNFEAAYRTEDWHYVRSKAEQIIDNWLYNRWIPHAYEKRVPIEQLVYSDFFIPIWKKVYIEYWWLEEDKKYQDRKILKIKFYKENNKNLIELTDKDIENLDDIMPVRLRPFLPSQFNFD